MTATRSIAAQSATRLKAAASFILLVLPASAWAQQKPSAPPSGAIRLTPKTVVELALSRGYRARAVDLQARRANLTLRRALGVFDLQLKLTPQYEYNEAQTIAGTQNPVDRTTTITSSLSKKFRTGSTLTLDTLNVLQSSSLSSTSTRAPNAALDSLQLTFRQAFWQNAFGYADRLAVEIGQATINVALETRDSAMQTVVLDSMTLFWNAYIAERQLRENLAAREKYSQLVRTTRQKAGFNLSAPGELPRLEAEMQAVEQRVKTSSASYLNALTVLASALQIDSKEPVEIAVPEELPSIPSRPNANIEMLRSVRAAQLNLHNAERALSAVQSATRPKLDFVAKAKTTGVEETQDGALSEMQSGSRPYYYVGLEFETPFGSDLNEGLVADAEVARRLAENELRLQTDSARDQLTQLERSVSSQYAIAKSAIEVVELRARVVNQLEVAYKQGRQPLVELIRSFNELFNAQQERAKAIGQYHIYLNQYAAAQDELMPRKSVR